MVLLSNGYGELTIRLGAYMADHNRSKIRLDIMQRLRDGRQLQRVAFQKLEKEKLGNLRAGNSGIMSAEGQIAGGCHRVAHLRQLGIELEPPTDSKLIMFQLGIANEDEIHDDLVHTAVPGEVVRREEEVPIEWRTSNGTRVTGRPDLVLFDTVLQADEKRGVTEIQVPVYGLELKSVASFWTTREVLFEGNPKLAHLVQAGHYMWKLRVPFHLIYKQYGLQSFPDFAQKFIPDEGRRGSEFVDYNDQGAPKNIRPFELGYELVYGAKGPLQFRREGMVRWTGTVITAADIERYYEFVSTMAERKLLGPKPQTVDHQGNDKSYSNCKYCPLKEICQKVDGRGQKKIDYSQWIDEVQEFVAAREEEK